MGLTYVGQGRKYRLNIEDVKGNLPEETYIKLVEFCINRGFKFNDIFEITKELLKNDKIKGSYCNSLLGFYVQEIDRFTKFTTYNLKDWHQLKALEDQFDIVAQYAIENGCAVTDVLNKVVHIYAYTSNNLSKIHQWEKYLKNHNLLEYKSFFYAKIITTKNREIIKNMAFIYDDMSEDSLSFYRFIDWIIPQINKYYKNENFYDCVLAHYVKKALLTHHMKEILSACHAKGAFLYDSEEEFNEISKEIYRLFREFEAFQGNKYRGEIDVFEDENDDKIKWHTKNFYKNLLDFYAIKAHDTYRVFKISEYVVWTLNMDMNPGFYSELASIYINLINEHKDINGKKLSPDKEQEYFQKIAELNEKINENSTFPLEDCSKINSFENLYEDLIEYYHNRKKFGIIITAFKNLSKDNKNTTYIIDKAVDAYITARGDSDNYLDLDGIIGNIGDDGKNYYESYDENIKNFYDKVARYYAYEGLFKRASLCCEIAMCNINLSNKNRLYFKNLRKDFLA